MSAAGTGYAIEVLARRWSDTSLGRSGSRPRPATVGRWRIGIQTAIRDAGFAMMDSRSGIRDEDLVPVRGLAKGWIVEREWPLDVDTRDHRRTPECLQAHRDG